MRLIPVTIEQIEKLYEGWDFVEQLLRDTHSDPWPLQEFSLYGKLDDTGALKNIAQDITENDTDFDPLEEGNNKKLELSEIVISTSIFADMIYHIRKQLDLKDCGIAYLANKKIVDYYHKIHYHSISINQLKNLAVGASGAGYEEYVKAFGLKESKWVMPKKSSQIIQPAYITSIGKTSAAIPTFNHQAKLTKTLQGKIASMGLKRVAGNVYECPSTKDFWKVKDMKLYRVSKSEVDNGEKVNVIPGTGEVGDLSDWGF